ncbi:MAG: PEGA domain-containing protein [Candidatus Shapirobacteria bacterium]|nr:PEGA domain-containing protein [Candidatus Shapirobacteria bacterium]
MNRGQKRNLITLASLILVVVLTLVVGFFVRGYRIDTGNKTLQPTGILSANSVPEGAQVWINGKLKTATNQTINLSPGHYQIEIKKPGFATWKKTIIIEREVVSETNARLFPIAPDLKALSFTGANRPQISPDGTKIVYFVISEKESDNITKEATIKENLSSNDQEEESEAVAALEPEENKIGLWLINLAEKPLGRSFQSRIFIQLRPDFNFEEAVIRWSPDSRKIIMIVPSSNNKKDYFLLDTNQSYDFTTPPLIGERENLALKTLAEWQEQNNLDFQQLFEELPEKFQDILIDQAVNLVFSPDEQKILYQVKKEINLPEKFITREIIGTSTQKENRQLKPGSWYVYDNKEDKNFLVLESQETEVSWFTTSRHLLITKKNLSIEVIEYDGQNQTTIYSGPFEDNYVFPFPSGKQLLILTSLNKNQPSDLYSISLE